MILRTVDWNRRYNMRKRYGFASGIVYTQPITYGIGKAPACDQRLRVKEWAYRQFGKPAYILYGDIMGADSEWFAAVTKPDEYTIAFKNAKYRNLALLMLAPLLHVRNNTQSNTGHTLTEKYQIPNSKR